MIVCWWYGPYVDPDPDQQGDRVRKPHCAEAEMFGLGILFIRLYVPDNDDIPIFGSNF